MTGEAMNNNFVELIAVTAQNRKKVIMRIPLMQE